MRSLLDVNVLVALLDSAHVHHVPARQWLEQRIGDGWASCPLTQNGCIRVMSSSAYSHRLAPGHVAGILAAAADTPWHEFWGDDIALLDPDHVDWGYVLGARQVTDVYLLALAVHRGGRLVTLDRSVPFAAVPGATEQNLVVIQ